MIKSLRLLPVIATAALLAGCNLDPPAAPPMFCPQTAVLKQGQTLYGFAPGRRDAGGEITEANVTGVAGSCALNPDDNTLTLNFQAGFSAVNGPANHGAPITATYIVAVADGDQIIGSPVYNNVTFTFPANAASANAASPNFKLKFKNQPNHLQVLVSWHLTPAQIAYAAAHPQGG